MNFSIAYGKTAHGFAQDWNCSIDEANESLEAWFREREEVRKWQTEKKSIAETYKSTQTLLGRYRYLYKYFSVPEKAKRSMRNMAMRRAINTPIQGGAADIVIAAMIKIADNARLR
jgi:DNA polymerase-1